MISPARPSLSAPTSCPTSPAPSIPSLALSASAVTPRRRKTRRYRHARRVPFELLEQCTIYFEEALYVQALTLLHRLLSSGCSAGPKSSPAFVPPASHLALVVTLAIHPSLTNRARSNDRLQASYLALQYLQLLKDTINPVEAHLSDAYRFYNTSTSSRRGTHSRPSRNRSPEKDGGFTSFAENAILADGKTSSVGAILSDLAEGQSLWERGGDFWAVAGWAFNCSVVHKARWEQWRLCLEHLVTILELDWREREEEGEWEVPRRDEATTNAGSEKPGCGLRESLLARYIQDAESAAGGGGGARRIVRSIFADGSKQNLAEFKEIWPKETVERKDDAVSIDAKASKMLQRRKMKLDIDEGEFGDYLESSSDAENEDGVGDASEIERTTDRGGKAKKERRQAASPLSGSAASSASEDVTRALGGPGALSLRLRLLALVSKISASSLPDVEAPPLMSLYDRYLTYIRPQPVAVFGALLSPTALSKAGFPATQASALVQYTARSLIEGAAPDSRPDFTLDQAVLETAFLPWAANTAGVADNAKVAICLETLLRMLDRAGQWDSTPEKDDSGDSEDNDWNGISERDGDDNNEEEEEQEEEEEEGVEENRPLGLLWSETLQRAVEDGIARREDRAKRLTRRKGEAGSGSAGEADLLLMRASGERIRLLVEVAKARTMSLPR